jgi:hypothetical protein
MRARIEATQHCTELAYHQSAVSRFRRVTLLAVFSTAFAAQELPPHLLILSNKPGSIEGKLVDGITGSPVRRTHVFAGPVDMGGDSYGVAETITGADGSFRFDHVSPHTYLITTDVGVALGAVNLGNVNISSSYFRVEAGRHLTGIVIRPTVRSKMTGWDRGRHR